MRHGGRYIDDGKGEPKRVDAIKDGKPNPEHHDYPDAPAEKPAPEKKEGK